MADMETRGWRDIETAPRDGTFILLWSPRWRASQVQRWACIKNAAGRKAFVSESGIPKMHIPTHWMPLPIPPDDTGGG